MYHTVYKITNLINQKIYVGVHAVTDLEIDDGYMGSGLRIKRAIKKYGKENFKKEILVSFEDAEAAYLAESMLVDEEFIARPNTYNMMCGGYGSQGGEKSPFYGKKHSKETKAKMSDAQSGRSISKETKAKMSDAQSGEKSHMYGLMGEKHPFYGKKHSKETKAKMSKSMSGEKHPLYGKNHSKESKAKMAEAKRGRSFSNEHRAALSAAAKEYWQRHRKSQV